MHAAELAVKERVAAALLALQRADAAAAAGGADAAATADAEPPSREALTVWLATWLLAPMLHTRRLDEIEALITADVKSIET
jgi:hypothetical protein